MGSCSPIPGRGCFGAIPGDGIVVFPLPPIVETLLRQGNLSVNLPKSEFCFSVVEWLGMFIDRFGVRPAPSKIEAITQLSRPSTVEEVRVLLGMAGYLRKFVPNYSSILAPISDLLRDPRFRSKMARRVKVPWSHAQTEAMETQVNLLTSSPILALPD